METNCLALRLPLSQAELGDELWCLQGLEQSMWMSTYRDHRLSSAVTQLCIFSSLDQSHLGFNNKRSPLWPECISQLFSDNNTMEWAGLPVAGEEEWEGKRVLPSGRLRGSGRSAVAQPYLSACTQDSRSVGLTLAGQRNGYSCLEGENIERFWDEQRSVSPGKLSY